MLGDCAGGGRKEPEPGGPRGDHAGRGWQPPGQNDRDSRESTNRVGVGLGRDRVEAFMR